MPYPSGERNGGSDVIVYLATESLPKSNDVSRKKFRYHFVAQGGESVIHVARYKLYD